MLIPTLNQLRDLTPSRWLIASSAFAALTLGQFANAQDDSEENVFELSPFTVDASNDSGYRAENSLSGSRLNSSLKDTAASISVFTQEFIEDVGLREIDEIIEYSVSSVIDTVDRSASDQGNVNSILNSERVTKTIRTRGVDSTKGLNYFEALIPDDAYRNDRYDDSRGPNGLLFGLSNAGGILNSSTINASTVKNSGEIKYTFGSNNENRSELKLNRVLVEDKLGVALAGLYQDSDGWRAFDQDLRKRIYGAMTWKANDRITVRGMGESGTQKTTPMRPYNATDGVYAWAQNGYQTTENDGSSPTDEEEAVGITDRKGGNDEWVWIEDRDSLISTRQQIYTGSYNDPVVRTPDGNPVPNARGRYRFNIPEYYPRTLNATGPDLNRFSQFDWFTVSADFKIAENFFANLSHNQQDLDLTAALVSGSDPVIRGDPNRTLQAATDEVNPDVGRFYIEANPRYEFNNIEYEDTRLSLSYDLDLTERHLGSHRLATAFSRRESLAHRIAHRLAVTGNPTGRGYDNSRHRVSPRRYFDEGDFDNYYWQNTLLPYDFEATTQVVAKDRNGDDQELNIGWVRESNGVRNSRTLQEVDTRLAVMQNHFFDRRLVTTFGYRVDELTNFAYALDGEDERGRVVSNDISTAVVNDAEGTTRTAGAVFHVTDSFSLIANTASSIDLPDFSRTVYPDSALAPLKEGEGKDYGISFRLLDNKISGRLVYYETSATNRLDAEGSLYESLNEDVMTALEPLLTEGDSPVLSPSEYEAAYNRIMTVDASGRPRRVDARLSDEESNGYELSLTANLSENWRATFKSSYTDRSGANSYSRVLPWYGMQRTAEGGLVANGITREGDDTFVLTDIDAFAEGGTIREWLGYIDAAGLDVDTFITDDAEKFGEAIEDFIEEHNDTIISAETRRALRPMKANIFTAYDFNEGRLKGFTLGGGYRWQSKNIMDIKPSGEEVDGRSIEEADLMMRYRWRTKNGNRISIQLNVRNLFDESGVIPQRFSNGSDFIYPNGEIAYSRYQLITPRTTRLSVGYSF